MILELYMKNCALVEESRVNLGENLNILTGETGSGKSIMIEALGLCLGNKYDKSFLRKGTEKGIAEIIVSSPSKNLKNILNEYEIDLEDDQLIITRIIYADGKSVARIRKNYKDVYFKRNSIDFYRFTWSASKSSFIQQRYSFKVFRFIWR